MLASGHRRYPPAKWVNPLVGISRGRIEPRVHPDCTIGLRMAPQYQRTRHKEGVFQIIGPTKRSIEKGVADGIVAAIRSAMDWSSCRSRHGSSAAMRCAP